MKILCLGDSITDCNRLFSDDPLGDGYVSLLSQLSLPNHPDLTLVNRGIDGFTISRLLYNARTQYLNLHPDHITILIGINDIALMMNTDRNESQKKKMMEEFFQNYEDLIRILKKETSGITLMEPFIFSWPLEFESWQPYVTIMSEGIRKLAAKYSLDFLPLREDLYRDSLQKGVSAITIDGVHLTRQGHCLLAEKLSHHLDNKYRLN